MISVVQISSKHLGHSGYSQNSAEEEEEEADEAIQKEYGVDEQNRTNCISRLRLIS